MNGADPNARPLPANGRARVAAARSGDRLRWGLTGLGTIFLVVMIAAASVGPVGRAQRPGAGESLAVLGVAPGPASRPSDRQ